MLDADGQLRHQQQQRGAAGNTRGAAVWAAGAAAATKPLSKSSLGCSAASRMGSSGGVDQLKLLELVGQGTFGQVYKALWRRRCVAVKVLQLPATAGSSDVPWKGMGRASSHREKMAVMETVVSTTMRWVHMHIGGGRGDGADQDWSACVVPEVGVCWVLCPPSKQDSQALNHRGCYRLSNC